jgi:hypothetical protein
VVKGLSTDLPTQWTTTTDKRGLDKSAECEPCLVDDGKRHGTVGRTELRRCFQAAISPRTVAVGGEHGVLACEHDGPTVLRGVVELQAFGNAPQSDGGNAAASDTFHVYVQIVEHNPHDRCVGDKCRR